MPLPLLTRYLQKRKLKKLLAGRTRESVLQEAPYGYGHSQGENGYQIWKEGQDPRFMGFASTVEAAEDWIIEHYLKEKDA